jgi:hypothetical protein
MTDAELRAHYGLQEAEAATSVGILGISVSLIIYWHRFCRRGRHDLTTALLPPPAQSEPNTREPATERSIIWFAFHHRDPLPSHGFFPNMPGVKASHSKSSAHIFGYKNSMKNQNQTPKGPKFGSLGGSSVPGAGPNAKPGTFRHRTWVAPRRSLTR